MLYIHLSMATLVGFSQLQHIWKAVLAKFPVASIIPSCFDFLPHLETQKWSCWDVATPHQIRLWSEHD
jgi:hypothetical protein